MEYFEKINEIRNQLENIEKCVISTNMNEDFSFKKVYEFIDEKLSSFKPSIMVYGIYNAGKSSLINALFGKEVSKVSDKAETYKIQTYEYNGFELFDTPGLNAPIEHEEVTKEHYKKCEIIIFVLSNDSFESAPIYDVLEQILREKKPLIIVLNQKVIGENEEVTERNNETIINKIQTNLAQKDIPNLDKLYNLVIVNAKSALKAKLENKNLLLKKSNIRELEDRLITLLKCNHNTDILNNINFNVIEFLNMLLASVNKEIKDKEIESLAELHAQLLQQKTSARLRIKNKIEEELTPIVSEVADLEDSISEKKIHEITDIHLDNLKSSLEIEIKDIVAQLGSSFSSYTLNIKEIISNKKIIVDDDTKENATTKTIEDITQMAINQLNNPAIIEQIQLQTKEITVSVLKSIKQWLPTLMKGKGNVWIANMASTFSKYIGPALTLGTIIYGKYSENAAADKEFNRKKNLYINTVNNMKTLVNKISANIYESLCNNLNELFDPKISEIKKQLDDTKISNEKIIVLKKEINVLLEKII